MFFFFQFLFWGSLSFPHSAAYFSLYTGGAWRPRGGFGAAGGAPRPKRKRRGDLERGDAEYGGERLWPGGEAWALGGLAELGSWAGGGGVIVVQGGRRRFLRACSFLFFGVVGVVRFLSRIFL